MFLVFSSEKIYLFLLHEAWYHVRIFSKFGQLNGREVRVKGRFNWCRRKRGVGLSFGLALGYARIGVQVFFFFILSLGLIWGINKEKTGDRVVGRVLSGSSEKESFELMRKERRVVKGRMNRVGSVQCGCLSELYCGCLSELYFSSLFKLCTYRLFLGNI